MTSLTLSTTAVTATALAFVYMPDLLRPVAANPVFLAGYGAALFALGAILRRRRASQQQAR